MSERKVDVEFQKEGLTPDRNNRLPREQRKVGNIGRLIAAARAAEDSFNAEVKMLERAETEAVRELAASQHELAEAKQQIAELTRAFAESQQQVKALELRSKVEANEFTQAQRKLLLENGSVMEPVAS